ncbi:MAG: hypothetical protein WC393_00065 [Candidatus Nanoarchaeia archaeon]|jgi:transcription initiation factor TFIIIB Brf1 subunit/transcription initiation factor TFIIB
MECAIKRFNLNERFIDLTCEQFSLTGYYTEEVKRLYYKALEKGLTRGIPLELTFSAITYYLKKKDGQKNSEQELSNITGHSGRLIRKQYRRIKRELRWAQ